MNLDHLHPNLHSWLDLSIDERLARIRAPRWIGYPQANSILTKLDEALAYPKTHRMPNFLIVGDTNNGKTMLINRFCAKHPADDNPKGDYANVPVLLVQAPPTADEGRFYNAILDLLFAVYKNHDRIDKKQFQVIALLKTLGLKMLIIDEIHHILAGSIIRQKVFLNVIKYLGNELQIPIVGVGTKDAYRAIQSDPQLSNRFNPLVLPRWQLDDSFLSLLVSFERMLPLKKSSNLHDTTMASQLLSMSEGYIGELSMLLNEAAIYAIKNGFEAITIKVLKSIDWVAPSSRKRQLDRLV